MTGPLPREARASRAAAVALLAASLAAGAAMVVAWHPRVPYWPDEHVYVQTAMRIAKAGRPSFRDPREEILPLTTFYVPQPSGEMEPIYPPGFPALLAAGRIAAGRPGMIWLDPLLALVAVAGTLVVARSLSRDPAEAAVAASLVAINPVVLRYAGSFMSDVAAMAALLAALALCQSAARSSGIRQLVVAGCGGLAVLAAGTVRPPGLLAAAPALAILAAAPAGRASRLRAGAAFLAGLAAIPVAVASFAAVTGQPLPLGLAGGARLRYLADGRALALFDPALMGSNLVSLARNLAALASGALLVPALAGFVATYQRSRTALACLAAWLLPTVLLLSVYEVGQEHVGNLRHFLPALPALAIAAAAGIGAAVRRLLPDRHAEGFLVASLFLVALSGTQSALFLRSWNERIPATADAVELAHGIPAGRVLLAGRVTLQAVAFHRRDLVLVAANQLARDDAHPVVPRQGEKIGWRLNMTLLPWDWSVMVPANAPRLGELVGPAGSAYVLVRAPEQAECFRALSRSFALGMPSRRGEFVLVEIRPAAAGRPAESL